MKTINIENVNKMSKYGLSRRPTYDKIVGMIDDNDKITGNLPNRDATMFKNSPEGSFFDGMDAMEQLKEEQGRILLRQMGDVLLRQNVRSAGRTYHAERSQQMPMTSPTIAQPTAPMDVEQETAFGSLGSGRAETTTQTTPTAPVSFRPQALQLNAEMEQRRSTATKRKEETATNVGNEIAKMNKPTIAQQALAIQPPRPFIQMKPQTFSIATDGEDSVQENASMANRTIPASSNQAPMPMNTSSQPKRDSPETVIEPRGKAGRPKKFRESTERADASKREGDEPEDTTEKKKRNKAKGKTRMRLTGKQPPPEEEEPEETATRKQSRIRRSIQKPVLPSRVGIQKMFEEFNNAKNKDIITTEEFNEFNDVFVAFRKAKPAEKRQHTEKAKGLYKKILYNKLKARYDGK